MLLGVVGFSLNAGVSRIVLDAGMDAWTLSEVRAVGAAIVLGLVVTARRRRFPIRVARHHWPRLVLYGLVGLGLLQSFYFQAIARIPIGLAILIEFLAPLWVALWARFVQKQAVKPILWPALAVTLAGLAIVAGTQFDNLDPVGLGSAFLAGLCFAVYFIVGERLVAEHDPFVVSFWGFSIAAVAWSGAAVFGPGSPRCGRSTTGNRPRCPPHSAPWSSRWACSCCGSSDSAPWSHSPRRPPPCAGSRRPP